MSSQHDRIESSLARLAERVTALGFDSLAEHERTALLAYSAHSLVASGGMRQFYEGDIPLARLVAAFRELKLKALANAALATASLFPDPALAEDPVARQAHVSSLNTDKQDYVFFRLSSEELLTAIASYWQRAGQPKSA